MAVQIGARPDSGFDDPLGMLKDCHRRIERFLGILCHVAERAQGRGVTDEEREAVEAALQYFRHGGQRHTADEEESLFPRMRAAEDVSLDDIDRLESDHREANDLHASVERLFMIWMKTGSLAREEAAHLQKQTERLNCLYSKHIVIEETVVFPRAVQMLHREQLAAIGSEFRMRRQ